MTAESFVHAGSIAVHKVIHQLFAVAEEEYIDDLSKGFAVADAGTSGNYEGIFIASLRGCKGNAGKLKHIEKIGIAHLVQQGEADNIEFIERSFRFDGKKFLVLFPQKLFHIHPRSKRALTEGVASVVENVVDDSRTEMAHAYLIGVGEAEREAEFKFILHSHVQLAAHIARRLFRARYE